MADRKADPQPEAFNFSRSSESSVPDYFRAFIRDNASVLSQGLGNGDLNIVTILGNFDVIPSHQVAAEIDELVQRVLVDTEALLYLHTHPGKMSYLGMITPRRVGFSEEDKIVTKEIGGKLKVYDLKQVYAGLVTACTKDVLLLKAEDEGRAFGWKFEMDK